MNTMRTCPFQLPTTIRPVLTLACALVSATICVAADPVDFANEIQTVLAKRCFSCHGPDQQEGGIRFDDRSTLIQEADSGEAPIVVGDPSKSELLRRITTSDEGERMPPEGKPLSEAEADAISRWIAAGAEYQVHWAFQPVQKYPIPSVAQSSWSQQPLDHFVLARLEANDLAPADSAQPVDLIRRAYLDVVGLPPSPETVDALLKDWSDTSYTRLVERLLADPGFGQRWARNWLDVVRYAETNSFERDSAKPNTWRYRDYVIRSFSDDKPYDQFLREQLAGDELDNVTPETLTATGYYRLGIWDDEPADPLLARFDAYDDLVTTTSQGMLGLTLNCARCHDHKIDPLTQKDYYGLVALLRDVTPYATRGDQSIYSQIDLDPEVAAKHEALAESRKAAEKRTKVIERQAIKKMSATDQRATEGPERAQVLKEKLKDYLSSDQWEEYRQLKTELASVLEQQRSLPPRETVLGLAKLMPQPETTYVLHRGSPHSPGEEAPPAFPKLLGASTPMIPEPPPGAKSAGRRRVLAQWITSKDNWLTARVIVNRVWLHYFGRGIVQSPNNFGLMGVPPTHPQLLDYLAMQLMENDWNLKPIHRMILLSATYRQSTQGRGDALAADPANNLFWRQNIRRLSAEQLRDSILAVSGELNTQQFGESMFPTLSDEVLASQSRPGNGWGQSSPADQARRSIYIHIKRSLPVPMLSVFDFPETDISCEARFLTVQPAQALTLLNSQWMQHQAERLLQRVESEVGQDLRAQAARVLELVTARDAVPADVDELVDLVDRLKTGQQTPEDSARRAMCLVALNLNPFLYIE